MFCDKKDSSYAHFKRVNATEEVVVQMLLRKKCLSDPGWAGDTKTNLYRRFKQEITCRIMATTNFTGGATQAKTELVCSPTLAGGLQQYSIYLTAFHIFLSFTAFLGNNLILVANDKESLLYPPSKLLYRCLAATDLCVGFD